MQNHALDMAAQFHKILLFEVKKKSSWKKALKSPILWGKKMARVAQPCYLARGLKRLYVETRHALSLRFTVYVLQRFADLHSLGFLNRN